VAELRSIDCHMTLMVRACTMYESICNAPLLQPKQSRVKVEGKGVLNLLGGVLA